MFDPPSSFAAVLNGLLTGAVYALVALGLTLIYGVLHIINFAHGALLTAAMFARLLRCTGCSASIPMSRAARPGAAVLRARLRAAALRDRPRQPRRGQQHPAGDARPRRSSSRTRCSTPSAPTRAPSTCPTPSTSSNSAPRSWRCRGSSPSARRSPWRCCCGCCMTLHRHRQGDPRRREGEARRAARRHRRRAHLRGHLRHRHRLPRRRRLPADADLLRHSARRQCLRAGRLHHRRARRHGLVRGRADRRLLIGVVESLSAACSSASRSARSASS